MSDLNNNIKLSYLYRDSGNYKQYGFEIFSNPTHKSIHEIEDEIKSKLIDKEYFIASQWNLPSLQKCPFDLEMDHNWHEFERIELTTENCTSKIDIDQFIGSIS